MKIMIKDKATLIGLVLSCWFLLVVIIVTAIRSSPILMTNSLMCLALTSLFIATEHSHWGWWHRYRESENRFWCFVALLFSSGALFASDSPIYMGKTYPKTAIALVFTFVLYINHWERTLDRKALGYRLKTLKRGNRCTSAIFSPHLVDGAREKLKKVREHLRRLDYKFAALKTWNQQDILSRERSIVSILSEATTDELNYILTNVNLPLLFYKIKDNDLLTPARLLAPRRSSNPRKARLSIHPFLGRRTPRPSVPLNSPIHPIDNQLLSPNMLIKTGRTTRTNSVVSSIFPDNETQAGNCPSPLLLPVTTAADVKATSATSALSVRDLDGGDVKVVPDLESQRQSLLTALSTDSDAATTASNMRGLNQIATNIAIDREDELDNSESEREEEKVENSCWNLCRNDSLGDSTTDMDIDAKQRVRNRTQLLNLIAQDRLWELNLEARVLVISALQHMPMSAHEKGEEWVCNIIRSSTGESLRKLKHLFDTGGDVHNLHKLIFSDIRSTKIRNMILEHLEYEGEQVLQYRKEIKESALPFPNCLMRPTLRKILSDVDDTLFSSGGRFPAGIDRKYKHHCLYPGVLSFYKELDLGMADSQTGIWPAHWRGNLAFLSARPHVYKDWSQAKSYKLFESLKASHNLHTTPTLLAGELFSSFQMFRGDFGPMALKKYQNMKEYAMLFPEYTFVFIGDNGQGDVTAAEMMCERFPHRVEAVFIHKVQKLRLTPGYTEESLKKWERLGIVFFQTYIGACLMACKKGLVSIRGLRSVARSAVKEFSSIKFKTESHTFKRLQELNKDIERCNEFLDKKGHKKVAYVKARHVFATGSLVLTDIFGLGRVLGFRHHDGIYEIELRDTKGFRVFILGSKLKWAFRGKPGDRVWTPYGTGRLREARETDGVHVVDLREAWPRNPRKRRRRKKRGRGLIVGYLQPKHIQVIEAAVGDPVTTAFGQGIVRSFRKKDGVFEIMIPWGNPNNSIGERTRSMKPHIDGKGKQSMKIRVSPSLGPRRLYSAIKEGGCVVRAYVVASQIHRTSLSNRSGCSIS
mmetsp:Transcript_12498/g.22700  ORF Transcript_12498/g.22700 Transcript_12498/m.22700 type:complete len:1040 (-) Transcript_12498:169-3288(-)|eukprot:CAMPEP_0197539640 /NCGR_PEP_ID=MMETSP1318-20131121/63370_1 /TAXON_ID=552666 /ORGANISM="Partenskyella glossopodia, Strain RCC365" /LENGTH=1039 /DNA_ID=CAMNT_0043098405 /DNA_START=86 /DNA_END=3208 /DNA_ORIENTATION=+